MVMDRKRWAALGLSMGLSLGASAGAVASLSMATVLAPTTVPLGGTSALTYTLTSVSGSPSNIAFTDTLSTGMDVVSSTNNCPPGGTSALSTSAGPGGATNVSFTGGQLSGTGATCALQLTVRGATAGPKTTQPIVATFSGISAAMVPGVTLTVTASPATAIPTLSEWALILLVASVAGSALLRLRRRS
jgi:hypothetical protein